MCTMLARSPRSTPSCAIASRIAATLDGSVANAAAFPKLIDLELCPRPVADEQITGLRERQSACDSKIRRERLERSV